MADILVRVPAEQLAHFRDDKLTSEIAFWRFGQKPKRLAVGDYIFFSRPEGAVAGAQIIEITTHVDSPDPSGKWNAVWRGYQTRIFERPVKTINYAQQSYRYLTPDESKQLRRAYGKA